MLNLNKNVLIKKFNDYGYLSNFLKVYAVSKMDICNSFSKLKTLFEEEFCPLEIRYESISEED